MESITVRRATEADRREIAQMIAHAYEQELSPLTKNMDRMAAALCSGVDTTRFFVAEEAGSLIGIAACTDHTGRAVYPKRPDLCKHLGAVKGVLSHFILSKIFTKPLSYDGDVGYIEFVAVAAFSRGKGVAKRLLSGIVEQSGYRRFMLEVAEANVYAIRSYSAFGFAESHRTPPQHPLARLQPLVFRRRGKTHPKTGGHGSSIYMCYPAQGQRG